MTIVDLQQRITTLSDALIPLASSPAPSSNRAELLDIIEGAFRKNLKRMQAIGVLSAMPQQGSSALELGRNMIEDVVSIEYILAKDGDKMATRFHDFRFVQLHEDLSYFRRVGVAIDDIEFPDTEANIEKEFARVTKEHSDFLDNQGKPKRSWSGRDVDAMMRSVIKRGVFQEREQTSIGRSYAEGSRKTHFNPVENMACTDVSLWEFNSNQANKLALLCALFNMIRLATRYIDLISEANGQNTHHDIAKVATDMFKELEATQDIT